MATTALPAVRPINHRQTTASDLLRDEIISSSTSEAHSRSGSSTSLSSLDETTSRGELKKSVLRDAYGNDFEIPNYTIKEIRDAIPAHCYERSALTGYMYVARDLLCLATTFLLFHNLVTPTYIPSMPVRAILWAAYTFAQGLFGTGIWVIAHECGHQSFSPSKTINDITGWVLHSALLVPYFSWKLSHGKHHKATGHMERDMVFNPKTREIYANRIGKFAHELHELVEETPISSAISCITQQLLGWPAYLLTNATGHNFHERQPEGRGKGKSNGFFRGVNHFNANSPLYETKDAKLILLSDLGLALVAGGLFLIGKNYGFLNLLVWYFIPYLWVNNWLVAITFLQHSDPTLPHYEAGSWNYVRGAAATIDREFGFIGRQLFHGIIETHVLHHYVSTIPFYHADEASEAIKPVMGRHYRSDVRGGALGFVKSLWTIFRSCQWVEPNADAEGENKGVLFFRNRNGINLPPAAHEKA